MGDIERLVGLDVPGHVAFNSDVGVDHPMRVMTRRAAGLEGRPWDTEARQEVAALFDGLASQWHTRESPERSSVVLDALERGLDPIIEQRAAKPALAVEPGSGLGTYTADIARRFELTVAVELSDEMHRSARVTGGQRVLADASELPLPDGCADAVVLVNCFLFPVEVGRLLATGGVLLWVNSSGEQTPIHLSTDEVRDALPFEVEGVESTAGAGTWCALRRR